MSDPRISNTPSRRGGQPNVIIRSSIKTGEETNQWKGRQETEREEDGDSEMLRQVSELWLEGKKKNKKNTQTHTAREHTGAHYIKLSKLLPRSVCVASPSAVDTVFVWHCNRVRT